MSNPEESATIATAKDAGPGPLSRLCDKEWRDLLDKDDRTSPAEYSDMVLVSRNEFGGAMSEAYLLALRRPSDDRAMQALREIAGFSDRSLVGHPSLGPDEGRGYENGSNVAFAECADIAREALASAERMPERSDASYRAVTEAFRNAQAEVPVDNSLSRWAVLADMQDRLAKLGLCGPSTSPAPTLVGQIPGAAGEGEAP